MKHTLVTLALALGVALAAVPPSFAQGIQTGILTGFVRGGDGLSLPGATVRVASPALQGERSTVTDVNGAYIIRGLPPGAHRVTFEFPNLQPVTEDATVPLGGTANLDAALTTVTATEAVAVVAATPSILMRPTAGINLAQEQIDRLPTGRNPFLVAELSPGLTNNTPNGNQLTVAGAFAYDNVFLIDGVDVNDNVFGSPENLFIEDAIDETQVLTSGISAEYGRFSGGVVNIVTKRGGNRFSGSFRSNFANQSWSDETPFEKASNQRRPNKMNPYYEGTFGGPIQRDKIWFFAAVRDQETSTTAPLPQSGISFETVATSRRWEVKGTATPLPNQTFQFGYVDNEADSHRVAFATTIDPFAYEDAQFPSELLVANWNGVLSSRIFATAQFSRKTSGLFFGRPITNISDSPFFSLGVTAPAGFQYNGPYFDNSDPEDRDNHQLTASAAYFASDRRWGTHDLKAGFERFTSISRGGNSQSPTDFVYFTDYLTSGGAPVLDTDGRLIPMWTPGVSASNNWLATRGAELDIVTTSLYFQDRWTPIQRLTLDLGMRYERVRSDATGEVRAADTNTWVPRVGATFDLEGNGRTILSASYGHYAGKYSAVQFGRNSIVLNPTRVQRGYIGPAGQGRNFAPAYDLSNWLIVTGTFPTANVILEDGLTSPVSKEFTLGLGREIGSKGVVRAVYTRRTLGSFVESFIDTPTASGRTQVTYQGVNMGTFDNIYYRNSDGPVRDYQGLQFQGDYRPWSRLAVAGSWTVQLRNRGNFEGEAGNQPGNPSTFGDYPEILVPERNFPEGRFDDYQRHKVRLWGIYALGLGRFGSVDIAPLWRYNSALTYSLAAASVPLTAIQRSRNPGYARLPGTGANGSQTLFFGERGSQENEGYGLFDLALNYQIPVWRTVRPWLKVEVLNVLNNDKLIAWDTTVTPDPNSPLDANGLPTGYVEGPRFGQGTATSHYPRPRPGSTGGRTYLGAIGIRF